MIDKLRKYRRDLHMIPELGHKEFLTHKYLLNVLKTFSCKIEEFSPTGLLAYFEAENPKGAGTIAFRADMDALAIEEVNNLPYKSKHKGLMHACGHDGHMAMLLALAEKLNDMKGSLPYNVLLVFQPAEESPGGAKDLVATGFLKRYNVKRIFALHLGPSKEFGTLMGRPLEMMARASELTVEIFGKSVHIASYRKGVDALYIGCEYIKKLYEFEQTGLDPEEFRLLRFGRMQAGTAKNSVANYGILEGSIRAFNDQVFDFLKNKVYEEAENFEKDYNCKFKIHMSQGYPAVINDPHIFDQAYKALDIIRLNKPPMTSEDFSYYLAEVPGLYLFLGTGNQKPLHSNDFDFDEEVLIKGVETYMNLLNLDL